MEILFRGGGHTAGLLDVFTGDTGDVWGDYFASCTELVLRGFRLLSFPDAAEVLAVMDAGFAFLLCLASEGVFLDVVGVLVIIIIPILGGLILQEEIYIILQRDVLGLCWDSPFFFDLLPSGLLLPGVLGRA